MSHFICVRTRTSACVPLIVAGSRAGVITYKALIIRHGFVHNYNGLKRVRSVIIYSSRHKRNLNGMVLRRLGSLTVQRNYCGVALSYSIGGRVFCKGYNFRAGKLRVIVCGELWGDKEITLRRAVVGLDPLWAYGLVGGRWYAACSCRGHSRSFRAVSRKPTQSLGRLLRLPRTTTLTKQVT